MDGVTDPDRGRRQFAVTAVCTPGIFWTAHSEGGSADYGWLAGSRILMFPDDFEERTTGVRTS